MKNIAVFASGSGSNAQNIVEYFRLKKTAEVSLIISDKQDAFVLKRAEMLGVKWFYVSRKDISESEKVLNLLKEFKIDFIVLAGFLYLVPVSIINAFEGKIVNIHPALLPLYGGKGMYGMNVHYAVKRNQDKFSGITIHFVNENYDKGAIIFQAECEILPEYSAETIAEKVHELEYKFFPEIIEKVILNL